MVWLQVMRIGWVCNIYFPTIAHPIHSAVHFGGRKRLFVIYGTFEVISRLIDRTEEVPIPPVGTPRLTEGFDLQERLHPPQEREVRGLGPKQLRRKISGSNRFRYRVPYHSFLPAFRR